MGVSNQVYELNLNAFQEWTDGINCFLHTGTNSRKNFGVGVVKNECGQSGESV